MTVYDLLERIRQHRGPIKMPVAMYPKYSLWIQVARSDLRVCLEGLEPKAAAPWRSASYGDDGRTLYLDA